MSNAPVSQIGLSNLQDLPDEPWADAIVATLSDVVQKQNSGLINLIKNTNIEIKKLDITIGNPWKSVTYLNAWTGTIMVAKNYDGSVEIIGNVSAGVYGTVAFNLGDNYRPFTNVYTIQSTSGAPTYGQLQISSNGDVIPATGAGVMSIHIRFMPTKNVPDPDSAFPVRVKTSFKTPPAAVIAIRNERGNNDAKRSLCAALTPSWSFIRDSNGPCVLVNDIQGLEYDCRQVVDLLIIGGE